MVNGGLVMVAAALVFGACGDDGGNQPALDAAPIPVDAEVLTPCTSTGGAGGTHKLFLNFESQELTPGENDATLNRSSIVTETVTSPPFFDGVATRDDIITLVVDNVTTILAPFDIEVVTTRPAAGPYTMIVLGGTPDDLGLAPGSFVVASNTCLPNVENHIHLLTDVSYGAAISFIIGAYGLGSGFGASKTNGACLCWNHVDCEPRLNGACTLSADEEVEIDPALNCDGSSVTTMNQHQKFKQGFGCRP